MQVGGILISKIGIDVDCSYEKHKDILNLPKFDG